MAALDYARFASMVASKDRNQTLNLSGKNIDFCMGVYLMSKKRLSQDNRNRINNVRNRLKAISPDISTDKFCDDFNEQLYYYWHEVWFHGDKHTYLSDDEYMALDEKERKKVHKLNFNTINGYVGTIRTILDWSQSHGADVTATYKDFPIEKEETTVVSLSRHDISHMYTYPLDKLPYHKQCIKVIERVRDQFVLNCITYGLRYSDLKRLTDSHFTDGTLRIKQKKTQRTLVNDFSLTFLHQIEREILQKYGSRDAIYNHDISNYNKHLKMLCQHLGGSFDEEIVVKEEKVDGEMIITKKKKWQKISSHTARHVFISINLAEGKPITEVQRTVGHASIQQTGEYAVHVDN